MPDRKHWSKLSACQLGDGVGWRSWACGRTSKFFPAVDGESNWSKILNVGSRLQPKISRFVSVATIRRRFSAGRA
jgi:hypothetical protein